MSLYTLRSGVTNHPETSVLQHLTDMVVRGGVLNTEVDLLVVEAGGGGLNVDIEAGRAYVKGTSTNAYPIRNTATDTVAVSANASGNPRIDAVVVYVDLGASPVSDGEADDVAMFAVVAGTPASSPVAPLDADIQTAVGAGNPWERLANVAVASGASGLASGTITNMSRRVFMRSKSPYHTLTYSSSITPDYADGTQQRVTLTGNITINEPTNMEIGDVILIDMVQDGTGSRTLSFNFTDLKEADGEVALTTVASEIDTIGIRKIATDSYYAYLVGGSLS